MKSIRITTRRRVGWLTSSKPAAANMLRLPTLSSPQVTSWPGDYDNYLRRREERLHAEAQASAAFDRKLAEEEVWIRQGIKAFSEWPTVPQLYVKGEFVGGSDIMREMFESGELQQLVGAEA